MLSRELDKYLRPVQEDFTAGRYIACKAGFQDPVVFSKGREVTTIGEISNISIANQLCNLSGLRSHPENYTEVVDEMFAVSGIDCDALPAITELYFDMRSSIDELLALAE